MISFEERFRKMFADCRVEVEEVSANLQRFHVYVGDIHCADSGVRDFAFRWALEDHKAGKIFIPPQNQQLAFWS